MLELECIGTASAVHRPLGGSPRAWKEKSSITSTTRSPFGFRLEPSTQTSRQHPTSGYLPAHVPVTMSDDDKTLSETIIEGATAMEKCKVMEPIAAEVKSLVNEYGEVIDGIGTVFAVVDVF
ncbi:hypothetical protein RJ55_00661 [Drechmeria coniospora]|nr:hypothetical protein RJ55_00661 [Drechmeria coniospora]